MSVTVNWLNEEKTAAHLQFLAPWTWEEHEAVRDDLDDMLHSVSHEVDLVIEADTTQDIPQETLMHLRRAFGNTNSNVRRYILVGMPQAIHEMFDVAERYYTALGGSLEFVFVDHFDDVPYTDHT
jgi:hypothetical protein